jgi:HPt (histidine-containing phosphotransfer) domain-containing protein
MDAEAYDQLVLCRQRELAMANTGAELEQLHKRYAAEDRARQEVKTKARYAPNGELHQLRQRVARLEQMISRNGPIVQAVGDLAEHLGTRIHALEQRPSVTYRGVWQDSEPYTPGNMVTHNGSVWHCKSACQGQRPPGNCWTLAVKSGRDGKDAVPHKEPVVR